VYRIFQRWPGVVFLLSFLTFAGSAFAQDTASLRGTVTDESGGVIVGAKVTLTNAKTNVSRTGMTGTDGGYLFTSVQVGAYSLTVEHLNFQKSIQTGIILDLNQNGRVDVVLKVGQASQTVEVTTSVAQVDTASAVLGKVEDERAIRDLPLLDRDTLQLGLLQAGVYNPDPDDGSGNPFNVSGQRSESLTFLLDGANNTDFLGNNIVVNPNPDAVEEFKILTNNYDAEYGRTSGGIVNQITKSGTNSFHGDAFEFLRNDVLNARDNFLTQRSAFKRNVFGGTTGGPIKKDKTFFFLAYQGARRREGETSPELTVLDQAERGGNFGEYCSSYDASGNCSAQGGTQLINPYTGQNIPYNNLATAGLVNPTIQNYISTYLPLPNLPNNGFVSSPTTLINEDQGIAHIDHNLTSHDTLSFVYVIDELRDQYPFLIINGASTGGDVPVGSGFTDNDKTQIGTLTWTRNIGGNRVNEARMAVNRYATLQAVPTTSTSPAQLGFSNVSPDDPNGVAPPIMYTPDFNLGPSPQGPTKLNRTSWEWADNFTWTLGKHELKFGADITRIEQNYLYDFYNNGSFDFDDYGVTFTGDPLADFVGGFWDNYYQFSKALYGIRTGSLAGYAQDTFKITRRFTLDYGLRYEYFEPQSDIHNEILGFFPGQQSTVYPGAPPDILYPGDPGTPNRALVYPDYNNLAPRLGFAWDIFGNAKLVMRGGGGIFYDIEDGALNLQFGGQPPFGYVSNNNPIPSNYQGSSVTDTVSDPFTFLGLTNPFPFHFTGAFLVPAISYAFTTWPHFRTPYSENFNYGFQWQATKDTMVEAVYVGSFGRKLISSAETDFPSQAVEAQQLSQFGFIYPDCARPLSACVDGQTPNNPIDPNGSPTGATLLLTDLSNGLSDSNQFQLTVDHRFSQGLEFRGAYSLAKTLDLTSGFRARSGQYTDPYDYDFDRSLADFNAPQRLVLSWIYELPFAHFVHSEGWVQKIAKGWQFNGIATFQAGTPFSFFSENNSSQQDSGLDRVDLIGSIQKYAPRSIHTFSQTFDPSGNLEPPGSCLSPSEVNPTTGQLVASGNFYVNPLAFNCLGPFNADGSINSQGVPLFSFGDTARNFIQGPGINNWDVSITKKTNFGENKSIEFRAEFFNAFNHVQFLNPNYDGGSSTFDEITTDRGPRLIQFGLKYYF
jgi:Carboxypeptidase regulatory-like domain